MPGRASDSVKLQAVVLVLACFAPNQHAAAQDHHHSHHDERSQLSSHVHGEATLTLIAEGERVQMQLISPAANIVGFEHEPQTAEQRARVQAAVEQLNHPSQLFQLLGARCRPDHVDVQSPFISAEVQGDQHHQQPMESTHKEFVVDYHWGCEKRGRLQGLATTLFDAFAQLQRTQLQWVMQGQQGAAHLTRQQPKVQLHGHEH